MSINGPYGSLTTGLFSSHPYTNTNTTVNATSTSTPIALGGYSNVMLIAGGIGITAILSILERIVLVGNNSNNSNGINSDKPSRGSTKFKPQPGPPPGPGPKVRVDVLWVVRDTSVLQTFIPMLESILTNNNNITGNIEVVINCYYTGSGSRTGRSGTNTAGSSGTGTAIIKSGSVILGLGLERPVLDPMEALESPLCYSRTNSVNSAIHHHNGRPDVNRIFALVLNHDISTNTNTGTGSCIRSPTTTNMNMNVCGPDGLTSDVSRSWGAYKRLGYRGHLHQESFGW